MLKKLVKLFVLLIFAAGISFSSSAQNSNGTYNGRQKDDATNEGYNSGRKIRLHKRQHRVKHRSNNTRVRRANRYKYKMIRKERRKPFYGRDKAGRRGNSFYYRR